MQTQKTDPLTRYVVSIPLLLAGIASFGMATAQSNAPSASAPSADAPTTENSGDEAVEEITKPEHNFPDSDNIVGAGIIKDRDEYLESRGWEVGFSENNPGGSYIGWATEDIPLGTKDKNYGNARILAIDGAVAKAMGEFALSRGLQAQTRTIRNVTQDPNALARAEEQSSKSYSKAIFNRLSNLTTAQLDQALEGLGVDSSEHQDLDYSQKVTMAERSVQRGVARQAFESFKGIRLLKTFEDKDSVGALVVYNTRFKELARRITNGQVEAIGGGLSSGAVEKINGDLSDEELIFMHGVRVLKDANGNPVLVAFGQHSAAVTRADTEMAISMAIDSAERSSQLSADGAIANFLGMQVEVDDESLSEMVSSREGTLGSDGQKSVTESAEFVQRMNSMIEQRSRVDLSGITTVRSWRANHPETGHLIVGSVKMWSPTTQAAFTDRGHVPVEDENPTTRDDQGEEEQDFERHSSPDFGNEGW